MKYRSKFASAVLLASLLPLAQTLSAQKFDPLQQPGTLPSNVRPRQLENVGIVEKLGNPIDLNLQFIAENGLVFLGFELPIFVKQLYAQQFPNDKVGHDPQSDHEHGAFIRLREGWLSPGAIPALSNRDLLLHFS